MGFRARFGPPVQILQFQKCVSYVVMKLPVLHDKVTIPSHRIVSLFHKATAPPGAWATQGTSTRSKKPLLGAGAFGGNYFGHYYAALIGRLFRACANSSTSQHPNR